MSHEDAVADIVEQRRLDLGLSVAAASNKAKINSVTWRRVENGQRVQPFNLAKVEKALSWPAGYLIGVLQGDEVVPYDETPDVEVPHRRATDEPLAQLFENLRAQLDASGIDHKERLNLLDEIDEVQMRTRRVQRRISA